MGVQLTLGEPKKMEKYMAENKPTLSMIKKIQKEYNVDFDTALRIIEKLELQERIVSVDLSNTDELQELLLDMLTFIRL